MRAATRSSGDSASMVSGEFPMTAEDFRRISAILHEDSGIHLPEGKAALVYSRLAKRLRILGLESFRDYCSFVAGSEGLDERRAMLAALTTNVTRFFREPHHFEHLKNLLAGGLAAKAKAGNRLRIWSAGCSTGEEPYSIAMTVLAALPNAAELDVRILASDIDPNVVATAQAGIYRANAASQIPPAMRGRLRSHGNDDEVAVDPSVKDLIAFRELNLMGDWPMKGSFDVIFCRNVAIYFEEATQARLWSRFAGKLAPGGRLYVGHSERVADPKLKTDGLTVYRLAGSGG